jgi:hypothetical protein
MSTTDICTDGYVLKDMPSREEVAPKALFDPPPIATPAVVQQQEEKPVAPVVDSEEVQKKVNFWCFSHFDIAKL